MNIIRLFFFTCMVNALATMSLTAMEIELVDQSCPTHKGLLDHMKKKDSYALAHFIKAQRESLKPIERGAWLLQSCLEEASITLDQIKDSNDSTILSYAARCGHIQTVELLFKVADDGAYAFACIPDSYGWTPLHWAAFNKHLEVVKALLVIAPNNKFACQMINLRNTTEGKTARDITTLEIQEIMDQYLNQADEGSEDNQRIGLGEQKCCVIF